jgi:hypothetical protein
MFESCAVHRRLISATRTCSQCAELAQAQEEKPPAKELVDSEEQQADPKRELTIQSDTGPSGESPKSGKAEALGSGRESLQAETSLAGNLPADTDVLHQPVKEIAACADLDDGSDDELPDAAGKRKMLRKAGCFNFFRRGSALRR